MCLEVKSMSSAVYLFKSQSKDNIIKAFHDYILNDNGTEVEVRYTHAHAHAHAHTHSKQK